MHLRPGKGNGQYYHLLGRRGQNNPTLRLVDFREQQGLYVLHDDHGPVYVGLTHRQSLLNRLKQHLDTKKWDRVSWFGFRKPMQTGADPYGVGLLEDMSSKVLTDSKLSMRDIEALLIQVLGTHRILNGQVTKFPNAQEWKLVPAEEQLDWMERLQAS